MLYLFVLHASQLHPVAAWPVAVFHSGYFAVERYIERCPSANCKTKQSVMRLLFLVLFCVSFRWPLSVNASLLYCLDDSNPQTNSCNLAFSLVCLLANILACFPWLVLSSWAWTRVVHYVLAGFVVRGGKRWMSLVHSRHGKEKEKEKELSRPHKQQPS